MKVKLSIRKYITWVWIIERQKDIRKEYKKLSDIPGNFLPKLVFVNEEEFAEALKICGSDIEGLTPVFGNDIDISDLLEGLNPVHGKDIDIEWVDDYNYQEKLDFRHND